MPLRLPNHSPRFHIFPICLFTVSKLQWVSKFSSISKYQGQMGPAASVWFVKVVCTLYVRRKSSVTEVRISDYLRKHLDSSTAFNAIHHMHSNWNNPKLSYTFLKYTKDTLNLVYPVQAYSFLLRSFCQVGVHDLAKQVIILMKIDGLLPDSSVLGFVIESFMDAGKIEVAKELITDFSQYNRENDNLLSFSVFNRLLSLLLNSNKVNEAVTFFEEVILRSQCYSPETYTFNIVISGLCRANKVNKAFEFFNQMKNFDCLPDKVTYNTLLSGFSRTGNVNKAHELLLEMLMVDGNSCSFSPDVVTFTSVIKGYCKIGKMKDALVLFYNMINLGIKPNTFTFNTMIDGFVKIGNTVSVLNFYKKMLDFGCTPDIITFTSIIEGHCRIGELQKGLKILDEMSTKNIRPNAYTFSILINSLCDKGRLKEAHDLLKEMKKRGDIVPKPFIYNRVIDGFCKAGNVDEANEIVKEMKEKRCKLDKITFTILIIGHCMKGRMVEAISLFDEMENVGCEIDSVTVNSLVSRLLKAGMPKEASRIKKTASGVLVTRKDGLYSGNIGIPVAV